MHADRPSATALIVALSVLREGRHHGLPDAAVRLAATALRAAGGAWRLLGLLARLPLGRLLLDLVEAIALRGLAQHHCRRKAWLWSRLRAAPARFDMLWLGAGFDGLGHALQAQRPGLRVLATDHPGTLALRRRITAPGTPLAALQLPRDAAQLGTLCTQADTLLVAEGLLMYLPPRAALRALRRLAALPTPPRLLFSALSPEGRAGRGFARRQRGMDRWLRRRGEPFLWRLPRVRLQSVLARAGYRVNAWWDGDGYGEYLVEAVPRGERVAVSTA